jgi:hypothetical protein
MSCKEEFDEKLIDCVHSFPVIYDLSMIYDLSKKSYKDKIAKDNAWKASQQLWNVMISSVYNIF